MLPGMATVNFWADDLKAAEKWYSELLGIDAYFKRPGFQRLLEHGATELQPITKRGDEGFVTASVVDPFGNILGVMTNPHYLEVLG